MNQEHDYKTITTPQSAFAAENIDINSLDAIFANVPEKFRGAAIAHMKKMVCTAAINGPAILNTGDTDQRKHYPWWNVNPDGSGGFALALHVVVYVSSHADVGARLAFETREKGRHYAENFNDVDVEYYKS